MLNRNLLSRWVNPACDDLDVVDLNNDNACRTTIYTGLAGMLERAQLVDVVEHICTLSTP